MIFSYCGSVLNKAVYVKSLWNSWYLNGVFIPESVALNVNHTELTIHAFLFLFSLEFQDCDEQSHSTILYLTLKMSRQVPDKPYVSNLIRENISS